MRGRISRKSVPAGWNFNTHLAGIAVRGNRVMSPKYRQDIIGVLRQMFNDALGAEDISRGQLPVFPSIEVSDTGFEILEEYEQDEILEKIQPHDRAIYYFIITYGTRPSEGRALKRDAIIGDFEKAVIRRTFSRNNRLRENPKEGRWQAIPLLRETR